MIKLYKTFNWPGIIWVYSDPHFDEPIDDTWPKPCDQIQLINSRVSKKDTIIFLGDIGEPSYIKMINGYKVLLLGNHDKEAFNYERKWYISISEEDKFNKPFNSYNDAKEYIEEMEYDLIDVSGLSISDNGLFDEVYDGPLFINKDICLSHKPLTLNTGINIHGHLHKVDEKITYMNRINVCSNVIKFEPVRLDKLLENHSLLR